MAVGNNNSPGLLTMFNVNPFIDYHASLSITGSLYVGLHSGNGEDVASESVKEKIRGIIAAEDQRKPYSDQHIAAALSNDSIEIARRTVAKYREAMGILPSSKRRQPFLRK